MTTNIPGTNVASAIVPFTTDDQFATHYAKYGNGGWKSVATIADRDAIPTARLEDGTVAYVVETSLAYIYLNGSWQVFVTSGGGGSSGGLVALDRQTLTYTVPDLPASASVDFELLMGANTSIILTLTVSRPVKIQVWSTPDHTDTNPYTFIATSDHLLDDGSTLLSDGTILKQRNYSIFANLESPPLPKVYATVTNVDGVGGSVSVDLLYVEMEGSPVSPGAPDLTVVDRTVDYAGNPTDNPIIHPTDYIAFTGTGVSVAQDPNNASAVVVTIPGSTASTPLVFQIPSEVGFHTWTPTAVTVGNALTINSIPGANPIVIDALGPMVGKWDAAGPYVVTYGRQDSLVFEEGPNMQIEISDPDSNGFRHIKFTSTASGSGSSTPLEIQWNGTDMGPCTTLNFSGYTWTVDNSTSGLPSGTINVSSSGGGSSFSLEVDDNGTFVGTNVNKLNFIGATVAAGTNVGTIDITVHPLTAGGTAGEVLVKQSSTDGDAAWAPVFIPPYVLPMVFTFSPLSSEVLLMHTFVEDVNFVADFVGSFGFVEIHPEADFIIIVAKNATVFGTITVHTDGTFTFSTSGNPISFTPGDTIKMTAPATVSALINNLSLSLKGIRVS